MKIEDSKLYTHPDVYFKGPDGMRNEVAMWYVASGLLTQEVARRKGYLPFGGLGKTPGYTKTPDKKDTLTVLDLCSGPGNFVNHLSFTFPYLEVTCVDIHDGFLQAGQAQFERFSFLHADVITLDLKKEFDVVTASSAYHHIEDGKKPDFVRSIKKHLKKDGVAIVCENFLPEYASGAEREKSIRIYYEELIKYYNQGNATKKAISAINEVYQLELAGVEEHKVPKKLFEQQVTKAGLCIAQDVAVFQPEKLRLSDAGSHVLVLKRQE